MTLPSLNAEKIDFTTVTELADDQVSQDQVSRICHRYYWAGAYCQGKDVLEVACGHGQGLGYLLGVANSVIAGDITPELVQKAQEHYQDRLKIEVMDAQNLPFPDQSLDVILIFEALYYLPQPEQFAAECRRVLRPHGVVLISNANKDMPDFNPSPYSHIYHGVAELGALFSAQGFSTQFFGVWPYAAASLRQRVLLPLKKLAVALNLMPKTMNGKKILKRLMFGALVPMPREIAADTASYAPPTLLPQHQPDTTHRVLYGVARKA